MSSPPSPLPNFIIIGAAKCGTTYLASRLNEHPQAFAVTVPKEPHYFTMNFERGLDWYSSLFKDARAAKAIGESSPTYAEWDDDRPARRIADLVPDARIIYAVRNPLERIKSHWMESLMNTGHEQKPFLEAVRSQPYLISSSRYWSQLQRYRRFFPDDRILVLFQEDMKADSAGTLRRCCSFLGIDPDAEIPDLERPANVKEELRRSTPIMSALRSTSRRMLGESVTGRIPPAIKGRIFKVLGAPIPPPRYDEPTRAWVVDRLRDEVVPLLEHCGKPADYWDLGRIG
ncbi:sulfotransferase domain-containing protein [Tautonia plasticadhaerens]|uniref:Sulfotransferase domain protein n=1 Tax=Tautonia plasticadhaerens TaxID=2527974 RepID=A0A518GW56_9BACT|nr:sulfotransferase domain-containing protein [Tautonia plasticadhaerens]QDV32825.1 Sulfotransferase domain protein [Tautonia plasticadhaerens]